MTESFPAGSRLDRDALVALIARIQAAPGTEQDTDADISGWWTPCSIRTR